MKSYARRLAALLTCAAIAPAAAQVTIPQEYGKTVKTAEAVGALGTDLFGDQTNFYTGSTTFSATDASLPGNSALPVAVGRRLAVGSRDFQVVAGDGMFADWDLDIPHLRGVFPLYSGWQIDNFSPAQGWGDPNQRCSGNGLREAVTTTGTFSGVWYGPDYWQGYTMYVPGVGDQDMLVLNSATNPHQPTDGKTYKWVTSQQWYVSCLAETANDYPGEGFLAISPDGTRYWFDHFASRSTSPIVKEVGQGGVLSSSDAPEPESGTASSPVGSKTSLGRVEVWALPTRVEDRFGNTVTYTYDETHPWRLTEIAANDGRSLALTYNTQGHIATVSDGSRTWTYVYNGNLTEVRLPDQSKWTLALGTLRSAHTEPESNTNVTQYCERAGSDPTQPTYTGTMTHPSGAVGTFQFQSKVHGRSYVPKVCVKPDPYGFADYAKFPYLFDAISLLSKSISGPGMPAGMTWTYTYGPTNQNWSEDCPNDSCVATKTVAVTGPDNFTRYTFSNRYQHSEGKLLKVETGSSSSAILRTETTDYLYDPAGQAFPAAIGRAPFIRGDLTATKYTPAIKRTIAQQGATFTWQVDQSGGVYAFDEFARVEGVTKDSSLAAAKTETTEYFNDTALWVLGQVERTTTNGIETARTDYGWMALPSNTYRFNKLQHTYTYDSASALGTGLRGTLKTVSDGRDGAINTTTTFTAWKRGIPGRITYPIDGYQEAVISNAGWITSIRNEAGFTTTYTYDPMGRLASINPPDETDPVLAYNDTTLSFAPSASGAYGLPAGHWKQTITTGRGRTDIHFDALWRPVVKSTYDLDDIAGTLSQTVTRYDAAGRAWFASYPQRSQNATVTDTWGNPAVAPNALGVESEYDALGRLTRTLADSELGALETKTEYLTGFKTRVTNPKLHQTTTGYQAWDQPTTDYPISIDHPEGARTTIGRDAFGKPASLRRHNDANTVGITRTYAYNTYQELCRTVEPETGATLMGYDAAGNLAWSAAGLPAGTACNAEGDTATILPRKSVRTYDQRNRVSTLSFPGNLGNTTYDYTPDGLLEVLDADNGLDGHVTTTYSYNRRRLPVGELTQFGAFNWVVSHAYNQNGHLLSQTYPNGITATYAPNALGQATQAGSHATNATYYPNGALKQFTYGNGIVHTLTQNARQLPDRSLDAYGSTKYLDDGYDYDGNGNVAAITDGSTIATPQRRNRSMTYDGLDRLKTVFDAPMFGTTGATYAYDVLDNLTRVTIGGTHYRDHDYYYEPGTWRLANVVDHDTQASVVGLDYDEQGNLTDRNGTDYAFDYGNRLRSVLENASGSLSKYVYDGNGRRVRDDVDGTLKYSVYTQAGQIVFTNEQRYDLKHWYFYLGGSLVAVRELDKGTGVVTMQYQHTDALGTPVVVTGANRNVLERSEYEPYGQVINRPVKDGPGFTGHVMDAATGLAYMQQRYYDPLIGRFLSRDPVTANPNTGANFNAYWYANNNPYRFTDPDGRQSVGEMIDSAAEGCGAVSCAGWAATKALWTVFGAEGVSQVADKGAGASTGDKVMAGIEVGTLGLGGKVGAGIRSVEGFAQVVRVMRAEKLIARIATMGKEGSKGIREVAGTAKDARKMFDTLRAGNEVKEVKSGVFTAEGANGGTVTFRAESKSGPATVDVNGVVEGVRKIKFLEE